MKYNTLAILLILYQIVNSSSISAHIASGDDSAKSGLKPFQGYDLKEKTLFQVMREFTREYPEVVDEIVTRLTDLIPDPEIRAQKLSVTQQSIRDMLNNDRSSLCRACKVIFF